MRVEYAGYTLRTLLECIGAPLPEGVAVGLWSLLQLPHGGELLVPVYARTEPKVFFGTIDPRDLKIEDSLVSYSMRAAGEHKIGIRAVAVAGRIGYRYTPDGSRWALVVRNVYVAPSGRYVDVPWDDTSDEGYAVQACNVDSALGSFSELEHHAPAIGEGTGRTRSTDTAETWAFRGSRMEIDQIVRGLLTGRTV